MTASLTSTGVTYGDSTSQGTAYIGGRGCVAYYNGVSGDNITYSSGNTSYFQVPTGVTKVKVTMCGGGGSGGGVTTDNGGAGAGGGGGAYVVAYVTVTSGELVTVTVGAGGAAAAAGVAGNAGGSTSFGGYVTAGGGGGGGLNCSSTVGAGVGGVPSGSYNFAMNGTNGMIKQTLAPTGWACPPTWVTSSMGGVCGLGIITYNGAQMLSVTGNLTPPQGIFGGEPGGSRGQGSNLNGNGFAATGYGNGGGGGGAYGSTTNYAGGAGAQGIMFIEW